jgi:transglutaminase-like putative cysteine protease
MFLLWLALSSLVHAAGDESVARVPAPGWAKVSEIDIKPESGADHGSFHYLLVDSQTNLEENATYQHLAVKLITEDGVENFAQLDFEFQPEYEQLEFHHIRIIRDGVVQERLPGTTFEVIRREKDMHQALFDGTMTAFIILEDVRPGDILSYAFTTRGANPIFAGNRQGFIKLGFSTPVDLVRRRLLWDPANTKLLWKTHGAEVKAPDFRPGPPLDEVEWTMPVLPRVDTEDATPGYFFEYPLLAWSSYPDWAAFGEWALRIYPEPKELPEELVGICDEIRASSKSPEEEIVNTLRWVQRNVRYLGSFFDEHTHAPYALNEILRRRFGDCKDKGVLTVAMLRHLGYDAAPALVNTSRRKSIEEYLPGHYGFNHLIVHLTYKGQDYFLDPTYTFQRGKLADLDFPDYGFAFLVRPGQSALHPLKPRGQEVDKMRIEESYEIKTPGGDSILKVLTVATGGEANNLRRVFSDDSISEIGKNYQEFYGQAHLGIEMASPIEFDDDEENNRFVVREHYRIPEFWKKSSDGETTVKAEIRASVLGNSLDYPEKQRRRHPYWLSHPKDITQIVDVKFPKKWKTDESSKTIEHPAFRYQGKVTARDDGYRGEYHYTSLAHEVQAKDFESYQSGMERLSDDLSIYLTHKVESSGAEGSADNSVAAEARPPSDFSHLLVGFTACIGLLAGMGLAAWMYFHDPAPRLSLPQDPQGIGGWLILPLIGTIVSPFQLMAAVSSYFTNLGEMGPILDAEAGFGVWRRYYVAGTFFNTLMVIPSVMLIVLMFRKRTGFPLHFAMIIGIEILSQTLLFSLERQIENLEAPADASGAVRSFMQLMIWGSYMLHSGRVKATFIRRRNPEPSL